MIQLTKQKNTMNGYQLLEYSLYAEIFIVLKQMCTVDIQSYHSHLLWHGIDICAELFNRKIEDLTKNNCPIFRQSRQVLLSWIAYIIHKINSNDYDFVSGLCDTRCYKLSDIPIDENLFDSKSIGPQLPPPTRLRLQTQYSLKSHLSAELLKPSPVIPYNKIDKKPFKEGKLSAQELILEERWKSFNEYKEIKYIKILLQLLLKDEKFSLYRKQLESCCEVLQYRYEEKILYSHINELLIKLLIKNLKNISLLTKTFIEENNQNEMIHNIIEKFTYQLINDSTH